MGKKPRLGPVIKKMKTKNFNLYPFTSKTNYLTFTILSYNPFSDIRYPSRVCCLGLIASDGEYNSMGWSECTFLNSIATLSTNYLGRTITNLFIGILEPLHYDG